MLKKAKKQLDIIVKKSRVHLYKPIQIAEILKKHREKPNFDLTDIESYRSASKRWRDEVSQILVGRVCTSSCRFQDNIFDENAMPPALLAELGKANETKDCPGIVESYIYNSFNNKIEPLRQLEEYIRSATPETFSLILFINRFRTDPGLKRSVDKVYEITVYALFATLIRHLEATVTLAVPKTRLELLQDFEDFTVAVLGLSSEKWEIEMPAKLYRVGVTNAADRGLDMWANFGPAVQVKHISLSEDLAEEIVEQVLADRVVIVCRNAEVRVIQRVLTQLGISSRVQGIITESDLERWYKKCMTNQYKDSLGKSLLIDLQREFLDEFPSLGSEFEEFMQARGYDKIPMREPFII